MSQEALAQRLAVERTTVARWEAGRSAPHPWARPRLAKALDVTDDELDSILVGEAADVPVTVDVVMFDRPTAPGSTARRVGAAHVASVAAMTETFAQADHQLGGGHARSTLRHYVRQVVTPLLSAAREDAVGRSLLIVAARVYDLAGFMCFDSGHHEAARRYFTEGLRLARAAGDGSIQAHILGDMTMQAIYTGARRQALELADAAVASARPSGSAAVLARALALAARARARAGDAVGADGVMFAAERALDGAPSGDDPSWIRFFTGEQLLTERLYVAADLGRTAEVESLAQTVLAEDAAMQRRHLLATAAVAAIYVPLPEARSAVADPDRALHLLRGVLPVMAELSTARGAAVVDSVRARLAAYGMVPDLEHFDEQYRETLVRR